VAARDAKQRFGRGRVREAYKNKYSSKVIKE
jgi:hypothetical protein